MNVEAGKLSREKKPLYESTIPKKIFNQIIKQWGPLTIDAFAARHNHQLPVYWNIRSDPSAAAMTTKMDVPKSPVETNTACSTDNKSTTTTASSTNDAMVAQPILVPHATETATPGLPSYHANKQEVVSSRMETINQTRVSLGIEDITAQFLQDSIRPRYIINYHP